MKYIKNSVRLIGNLGMDPEVKSLENGGTLVKFRMATSDTYTTATGETKENVQWHSIVMFGKVAEVAGLKLKLKKGDAVAIEGQLRYSNYTDNNGESRWFTDIMARDVMLTNKKIQSVEMPMEIPTELLAEAEGGTKK
jgi:single-strand DNA-binding protein